MLPVMLKGGQFPFVIDLACWASKRKFLKLDIWMVEKIKEHQVQTIHRNDITQNYFYKLHVLNYDIQSTIIWCTAKAFDRLL